MKKVLQILFLLCCVLLLSACNKKNDVEKNVKENVSEVKMNSDDKKANIYEETLNMLNDFEIKKGKIIFVNFWATWCGPCVGEMPDLQELYNEIKNDNEVEMIFVNLGDTKDDVKRFIEDNKYTMPMYCDESGKLGEKYEIYAIPQTFIFDKDANMIDKIIGANSKDVYSEALKKALGR